MLGTMHKSRTWLACCRHCAHGSLSYRQFSPFRDVHHRRRDGSSVDTDHLYNDGGGAKQHNSATWNTPHIDTCMLIAPLVLVLVLTMILVHSDISCGRLVSCGVKPISACSMRVHREIHGERRVIPYIHVTRAGTCNKQQQRVPCHAYMPCHAIHTITSCINSTTTHVNPCQPGHSPLLQSRWLSTTPYPPIHMASDRRNRDCTCMQCISQPHRITPPCMLSACLLCVLRVLCTYDNDI